MIVDRRQVLAGFAGTVAALVAPTLGRAAEAPPVVLTAGRRTLEVNGRAASVFGLTQPNGTAGLSTSVGTPFRVRLRNDIGTDTLIHWHGLMPPYRQDGVPGISGPPIPPGGTADYDFPLAFPGTYFMHSHQGLQEQVLLSAPLIVHDRAAHDDRQEVVLMLHDFSFRTPKEIFDTLRHPKAAASGMKAMPGMGHASTGHRMAGMSGMAGMAMDLNDVAYDAFLANDRTLADPQVVRVEPGGRLLLRIINAAASSNFMIDLGPVKALLVAVDGHAVRPVAGSLFPIAIAQRLDLAIDLGKGQTVTPIFATLEGERMRTGLILATARARVEKLKSQSASAALPLNLRLERALRAVTPLAATAADRTHRVALTGSMAGYVWGLDGKAYGEDRPLGVAAGERVELVMVNRTTMAHPMHLHGHRFQVVAIDGRRFAGAMRDTVLVPPNTSVTIAFDADNPGHWAFHCHNLYHMEAGMMTTVRYEGT